MEKEEIIDILVLLYHRRLKALLPYQDESSTRELVKQMFDCTDEISQDTEHEKQRMYYLCTLDDIRKILQCNPAEENSLVRSKEAVDHLTLRLESYYMYILHRFCPETRKENNKPNDCRAYLGERFRKLTSSMRKERNNNLIVCQQIRASHIRNEKAHLKADYTLLCHRYQLLCAYDIILTYLLYTFYYQTFAKCEKNNLKEELHGSK